MFGHAHGIETINDKQNFTMSAGDMWTIGSGGDLGIGAYVVVRVVEV